MFHVCEHVILMSVVFLQKNHLYFVVDFLFVNVVQILLSCLVEWLKKI